MQTAKKIKRAIGRCGYCSNRCLVESSRGQDYCRAYIYSSEMVRILTFKGVGAAEAVTMAINQCVQTLAKRGRVQVAEVA